MGNIPKPGQRKRAHRRLGATVAGRGIYKLFVKPFLDAYNLKEHQTSFKEGIEAFFNVEQRPIMWCKALEAFKIPGEMWASPSEPYKKIVGTGDRLVHRGGVVVVRQDLTVKDKNEIEFKDQVFVLTDAQFAVIKEKLKPIV